MASDGTPEEPELAAGWDNKRKAWDEEMKSNERRARELLATLKPRRVEMQGLRLRGGARRRARRGRW
jgi:hypothetical protein